MEHPIIRWQANDNYTVRLTVKTGRVQRYDVTEHNGVGIVRIQAHGPRMPNPVGLVRNG